jgi:hypothetical protein
MEMTGNHYLDPNGPLGLLMGTGGIISGIVIWLYFGFCMMSLANRFGRSDGWLGFIPIVNLWYMLVLGDLSGWLVLTILLGPVYAIVAIIAWWKMSEKTGKGGWLALLLLIPGVNLLIPGIIAWA